MRAAAAAEVAKKAEAVKKKADTAAQIQGRLAAETPDMAHHVGKTAAALAEYAKELSQSAAGGAGGGAPSGAFESTESAGVREKRQARERSLQAWASTRPLHWCLHIHAEAPLSLLMSTSQLDLRRFSLKPCNVSH